MSDRNERRGELRPDERDPKAEREPQDGARGNNSPSTDDRGRDANRDGSDSNASH